MNHLVNNPVYQGLISGDRHLSFGTENVKFFDERVSPFAGFDVGYEKGFKELYDILPAGRTILYATPGKIHQPKGWQLLHEIKGLQLVFDPARSAPADFVDPTPLTDHHVEQMLQLTALTNPGPFGARTIDFGHYYGIFENKKLIAMSGQRLHVQQFTEVSAVCTHPDHLGRGYAAALVRHQVQLIRQQNQTPFLHVRDDNRRAIELYQRIGFAIRGAMNFYVMKRESNGASEEVKS